MANLTEPIAVVCHDAGAANILLAWLKQSPPAEVRPFMGGPALELWLSAFPRVKLFGSLKATLEGAGTLLSGTGWSSTLEHEARCLANLEGIHSVAVLDHWVNYPYRFKRGGVLQWPSEFWVADVYALEIANQTLPRLPISLIDNFYLAEQVRRVTPPPEDGTVLLLMEPARSKWGKAYAGEFQALEYAFDNFTRIGLPKVTRVLIRPHPSESPRKYERCLYHYPIAQIETSSDVCDSISKADVVLGLESSALVIALSAGRPVFSCIPPWAPQFRLPHSGIKQIRYFDKE